MGSSRLPGKVLEDLGGRPMLRFQLDRLAPLDVDHLVVATSTLARDDAIAEVAAAGGTPVVRGPEADVLERFLVALRTYPADTVVRLTGDCPLSDPGIIGEVVALHHERGADYTSNVFPRTFPKGLDVEVVSADALRTAAAEATDAAEREHVTPYLYRHPERFRLANLRSGLGLGDERWTVDTTRRPRRGAPHRGRSGGRRGFLVDRRAGALRPAPAPGTGHCAPAPCGDHGQRRPPSMAQRSRRRALQPHGSGRRRLRARKLAGPKPRRPRNPPGDRGAGRRTRRPAARRRARCHGHDEHRGRPRAPGPGTWSPPAHGAATTISATTTRCRCSSPRSLRRTMRPGARSSALASQPRRHETVSTASHGRTRTSDPLLPQLRDARNQAGHLLQRRRRVQRMCPLRRSGGGGLGSAGRRARSDRRPLPVDSGAGYDCIIPVSGGKDSTYQTIRVLELGLNPLCVTATTDKLSEIGRRNLENLKHLGVDYHRGHGQPRRPATNQPTSH